MAGCGLDVPDLQRIFFEAGVHAIIGLSFGRHQRALRDAAAHSAADCGDLIR